jgi:hypothetical protein
MKDLKHCVYCMVACACRCLHGTAVQMWLLIAWREPGCAVCLPQVHERKRNLWAFSGLVYEGDEVRAARQQAGAVVVQCCMLARILLAGLAQLA